MKILLCLKKQPTTTWCLSKTCPHYAIEDNDLESCYKAYQKQETIKISSNVLMLPRFAKKRVNGDQT